MSYLFAMLLGLIQGITEFLPISSSGHLSIMQNFFGMQNVEQDHLMFDVLLHFGTLISVCIVYRKDILDMLRELVDLFRPAGGKKRAGEAAPPARRLILLLVVATLPLLLVLPLNDYIERLYYKTGFIGFALLVTGALLYISGKIPIGRKNERSATVKDALIVGLSQMVAVLPGLSRSGSTITTGLLAGFDPAFAVRFSFLLSLPAVLGANILSLFKAVQTGVEASLIPVYLSGVAVAAVSGYFAIGLIKRLSQKGSLKNFSYYCWTVGAVTIILSFIIK